MTTRKQDETFDLPPTHMERIDLAELKHTQEMEKLKLEQTEETKRQKLVTAASRHEVYITAAICTAAAAVLLGIIGAITYGTTRPEAPNNKEAFRQEQYKTCVAAKGTWIAPSDYTEGYCIAEGKVATGVGHGKN